MSEQNNNQGLIARLLLDRDAEYRRANMTEQQLAELSGMNNIKQKLEQKIASQEKEIQQKDKTVEKLEGKYRIWNKNSNIWSERFGKPCRKEGNSLRTRHSGNSILKDWTCLMKNWN